jgi:hypothetical protein
MNLGAGKIISCDRDDVIFLNSSILTTYYSNLSNGNVTVINYSDNFDYVNVAICKECKFFKYFNLKKDDTMIIPAIEEFCRDHKHIAALDRE